MNNPDSVKRSLVKMSAFRDNVIAEFVFGVP